MYRYRVPRSCRPPAVPLVEPEERGQASGASLAEDIRSLDGAAWRFNKTEIDFSDGATAIHDAAAFEALSHLDDVPGALGVREVKFLVTGVDTKSPRVFFLNTRNWQYHYLFARDVLGVKLNNAEFNLVTYFTSSRRFLAGTVIYHEKFRRDDGALGLYALEFWPTDNVGVAHVTLAYELVSGAMPFAGSRLAYHPSGAIQEELYEAELQQYGDSGIRVVRTAEIFESVDYSPLNPGVGFGRLRVIDGAATPPPAIRDVVVFKTLPNDLSHVAGVLSEEPQTPLSHVNLRAKQNNTPNAYLRAASQDPRLRQHLGGIVRFEVKPDDIDVRAATAEELEEHLEAQRPEQPQFPPRDLKQTEIVDLDRVGHGDLRRIGAKAANLAELRKILDHAYVPAGYAVPFHFYHSFMEANGFYDQVRAMVAEADFKSNEAAREDHLRRLRKQIRKADVPEDLRKKLGDMHARFPAGTTPRCRSSTNNEDLVGFNGAGLYDSFTHREDEGHIEKSIKQVWASLWNFRAFEEREFYRIDHFTTAMGVLVHPNFDDEIVNGVALTKNIYFPNFAGFYVNAQIGEALVTNPDPNAVSEEFLVMQDVNPTGGDPWEIIRIRRSNLVQPGETVLQDARLNELISQMEIIQAHFRTVYGAQDDPAFAMDLEFKVTSKDTLAIKQARPWVD